MKAAPWPFSAKFSQLDLFGPGPEGHREWSRDDGLSDTQSSVMMTHTAFQSTFFWVFLGELGAKGLDRRTFHGNCLTPVV